MRFRVELRISPRKWQDTGITYAMPPEEAVAVASFLFDCDARDLRTRRA